MNKNEYIAGLCECPIKDELCPYYDWRYQKCNAVINTEPSVHPKEICDDCKKHLINK